MMTPTTQTMRASDLRLFLLISCRFSFFFNDTAPTEIYTLSLHDALPIFKGLLLLICGHKPKTPLGQGSSADRKSTRLNSSHGYISYAVFCLEKNTTSADSTAILGYRAIDIDPQTWSLPG